MRKVAKNRFCQSSKLLASSAIRQKQEIDRRTKLFAKKMGFINATSNTLHQTRKMKQMSKSYTICMCHLRFTGLLTTQQTSKELTLLGMQKNLLL